MTTTTTTSSLLPLFLFLLFTTTTATTTTTLYFSPSTFTTNYNTMQTTLKIFIYPHNNLTFTTTTTSPLSIFYTSLINSLFITHDPNLAHLFFLPFPPQPTRSLARVIHHLRTSFPFWNHSLATDHLHLSPTGIPPTSTRNLVELRKNAVQISSFPITTNFIPHKDITLPPLTPSRALHPRVSPTRRLGYWRFVINNSNNNKSFDLIKRLKNDGDFLIESDVAADVDYYDRVSTSKFCLIGYNNNDEVEGLGVALVHGCVPVVITDRPIQDLPLNDVIKWEEIALFVGSRVGPDKLRRVMNRISTCEEDYERMRELGAVAVQHLLWNRVPQPFDAFNMVMYQLWVRRHAIRYGSRSENMEDISLA